MAIILDRRNDRWNESGPNRQRFLARYKKQIQDALRRQFLGGVDMNDEQQEFKVSFILEFGKEIPELRWIRSKQDIVIFNSANRGDVIYVKKNGGGSGSVDSAGNQSSDDIFQMDIDLSLEEFLSILFNDMELPNFIKTAPDLVETFNVKSKGYVNKGAAVQLDLKKTLENSIERKLVLEAAYNEEIKNTKDPKRIKELEELLETIPFLEDLDVKYHNRVRVPKPNKKAVVFYMLDVSGSVGETQREVAKRFFLLFNLFIKNKYDKVEVVYITHTVDAEEEDSDSFFNSQKNGGTILSSAYELMEEIITERYDETWNIYGAHASDGDNYYMDNTKCNKLITKLSNKCQFMLYLEVPSHHRVYREERTYANMLRALSIPNVHVSVIERREDVPSEFYKIFKRKK